MKVTTRLTLINIIAAVFIFLFTYTALSKFLSFATFRATLQQSPLIKNYAFVIAWLLPVTELLISILLFIPLTRLAGLYSSFGLMTLFTLYILYMLLSTSHLPCSCGGVLKQMTWKQHFVFNILFTLLGVTGILLERQRRKQTVFV